MIDDGPAIVTGRPALLGRRYMISSTHYLATLAGARIFARGGTAIDAGIAAGLAMTVVERHYIDFGGVAPIMLFAPGMSEPVTIDGVGRWPASVDLDAHRAQHGDTLPPGVARAVTPGAPDAWLTALARYGRCTLADVLQPAIELCEGFPVTPRLASEIAKHEAAVRRQPSNTAVFLPDGRVPRVGELLVQSELGAFFRRLVEIENNDRALGRAAAIMAARDEIYCGEIARRIADFVRSQGGSLSLDDLKAHRATVGPAIRSTYRGYDVYACGPWSQGPLIPMTLNLLERSDVGAMGPGTLPFFHRFAEAMKLACADREGFFGDPDLIDVPIRGLLSKEYAEERAALLSDDRAWPELPPPGDPWRHEGRSGRPGHRPRASVGGSEPDTSYVCAMDEDGHAFSATPSDSALRAPIVPGLGIVVSGRGSQLWTTPGHPSAIAPGKRPRLTPNPALLARDGKPVMPFGCPGEDAQCQAMVQVVCNVVDFGMDVQEAIERPRVISRSFPLSFYPHSYSPGELRVEGHVDRAVRDGLAALGHRIVDTEPFSYGAAAAVCAVRRRDGGSLEGGADPRRECYALGW